MAPDDRFDDGGSACFEGWYLCVTTFRVPGTADFHREANMTTTLTGTFVDGAIQLDQPVNLPNHSRVTVQVQPLEDWRERMRRGLKGWREYRVQHPTGSGGLRFTREELHERD